MCFCFSLTIRREVAALKIQNAELKQRVGSQAGAGDDEDEEQDEEEEEEKVCLCACVRACA